MKKLFCTICDRCRKLCEGPFKYEFVTKTGKILHFCSEECRKKHTSTRGLPPKPIPFKDTCVGCGYWTGSHSHRYKCYTHECPAFIREASICFTDDKLK